MTALTIIAAAGASYAFGAVWYIALSGPWMRASGVAVGADGKPANAGSLWPFLISGAANLIVAAFMTYAFPLGGVDTPAAGALAGFGIGLFLIAPWLAQNYGFAGRPATLFWIDGAYAVAGPTLMGFIIALMQ